MQIIAERERQELAMELARQVEENKRLRKSLLAQSTKFLSLRQSNANNSDVSLSTSIDHRLTPVRKYRDIHSEQAPCVIHSGFCTTISA